LDSQNKIYKHLFENAGEGMVVTNNKGVIELVNPRLREMFGYKTEELIGERIEILVPQSAKANHKNHREKYLHHPNNRRMGGDLNLKARR